MQNYFGIFMVLLASVFFMGCEKEHSTENGGGMGGPSGTFRARIDGVPYNATVVKSATRESGVITLTGKNDFGQQIHFELKDSGVHNYSLHNTSITNVGTYIDSTFAPFDPYTTNQWFTDSIYGNVNITAIDTVMKTMSGTFKMKVFRTVDSDEVTITDGVFNNISYGVPSTPQPATNFFVKVDGVEFVETGFAGLEMAGFIVITAMDNNSNAVVLTMMSNITTGTHQIGLPSSNAGSYSTDINTYNAESGTLNIIEHNTQTNRIKGTFSFVGGNVTDPALPDVGLTEGSFELTYN